MSDALSEFTIVPVAEMSLGETPLDWPDRPDTLAGTLEIAGQIGERFPLLHSGLAGPDVLAADNLTDADIARGIADRGRDVGSDEDRVASVLFLQTYVYRVAAPMLAAWVLHGRIPDVSASNLVLRFNGIGRPQDVAMKTPRVYALPGDITRDAETVTVTDLTDAAIRVLLDGHLLPMTERLRQSRKMGLPLARGAVASQIGMALTFIDAQSAVPWQTTAQIAVEFFERTADLIAGQGRSGDMHYKQLGDREGVTFRRGTCCLVYRVPGKGYCGGCPLRSKPELLDTWSTRLLARPTDNLVTPHGRCDLES